ncbi:MAG TPA: sigma-70 family RNA polymerase sigma factor [Terracidiphilus sp.]
MNQRMRWSLRPVGSGGGWRRNPAQEPYTPGALGGLALAGAGGATPELGPGFLLALAKAKGTESGEKDPGEGGPGGGKSLPEETEEAQPSDKSGVPKSMATMVLDSSALGGALAHSPEVRTGTGARAEIDRDSDAALMLRLAAGDETCFTILAEKYHRPMIHFLFRMVRNQAIAEELAQEVFLRVYRSRESYRAEAKFSTWLYRIATNLAVNYARDTRRERGAQTVYLDAPDEETGTTPEVADERPNVEQRLMRNERMAAIRAQVMALPERQRAAVLMHKYQGLDYRQIGEVLKLSESATKSLLFRAYQTLRDTLQDFVVSR